MKGDVDPEESVVNIPKAMPGRVRGLAKSRPMRVSQGVISGGAMTASTGGAGGGVGGGSGAGSGPIRPTGTLSSTNSPPALPIVIHRPTR